MQKTRFGILGLVAAGYLAVSPLYGSRAFRTLVAAEPDANVLGECDFDPDDAMIKVPVQVRKETYNFGLATSLTSLFRTQFADKLDPHPLFTTGNKLGDWSIRLAPNTSIGGVQISFPGTTAVCGRLGHISAYWSHSDGVIGLDALMEHIVEINFDQGKVRFLRSVPETAGQRFQITSLQKRPRLCAVAIKAQCCNELAESFYIELENPDTIQICWSDYRRRADGGMLARLHSESTLGLSSLPVGFAASMSSFNIGPFRAKDVRTVAGTANVIGKGFLARFVVTFDFPTGHIYLRPGAAFDRKDGQDISGLHAGWEGDSVIVHGTDTGSPAAAAGLQPDDLILAVDGKRVNRANRAYLWRRLHEEGSTLRLRIKRADADITVNMKLERTGVEESLSPDFLPSPGLPLRSDPGELPDFTRLLDPENG